MTLPFRGNFRLTQGFGGNRASYIQFGLEGHNGLDYGTPINTQIIAPHPGKIIEVADEGNKGYGKYIKIENAKEGSVLAHLSSFQVKVGDFVSEGQPVALSGNTGNSTGPHLHWGYYLFPRNRQNGYAGFINQLPLITHPEPSPTPLPTPNPGYAPTHEGQTVEKDGIIYESYKQDGKLLWKTRIATPKFEITEDTIIPQIENMQVKDIKNALHNLAGKLKDTEIERNNAIDKINKIKEFVKTI